MLLDIRHDSIKELLHRNPVLHRNGDGLALTCWLKPGSKNLQSIVRDHSRFAGIDRWYVLGEARTISEGSGLFAEKETLVPVPVTSDMSGPLWLGDVLRSHVS
jgi:hypothetical protein